MNVEVYYESYPYEITEGFVKFNPNGRAICVKVVEVDNMSDMFKVIEEKGFSNQIMNYKILVEDDSIDSPMIFSEKFHKYIMEIDKSKLKNTLPNLNGNIYSGIPEIKFYVSGKEI